MPEYGTGEPTHDFRYCECAPCRKLSARVTDLFGKRRVTEPIRDYRRAVTQEGDDDMKAPPITPGATRGPALKPADWRIETRPRVTAIITALQDDAEKDKVYGPARRLDWLVNKKVPQPGSSGDVHDEREVRGLVELFETWLGVDDTEGA